MPKVLRIINRLNLGGPTYNAAYLTGFLNSSYETLLLSGMKDESEASSEFILSKLGIRPTYIPDMRRSINPMNDFRAYRKIVSVIRRFKPDIVHTHAAKAGALGRVAAYHCNVPVIVHTFHGHVFHSYFNPVKTKAFIQIERFLARISTGIVAISNLQKQELCNEFKICPEEKVRVIPLGFDLERFQADYQQKRSSFRAKYKIGEDVIAIGIIGRLVPVKNHPLFLKAFKKVIEQTTKKVVALIIGDGEEKEHIIRLAESLGVPYSHSGENRSAPLLFTSWITNIDEAMAGLDIVAMTSFNEGTPVSLIEAQAANKAIVTTAVGGIEDIVLPGQTALLSPSNNAEQFSRQLLTLVEDDSMRISMGRQGYDFVKEKFSFKRLTDDMSKFYDELLRIKTSN